MMNEIIEYVTHHEEIRAVSADIFDTLLFRTVREPADVFVMMYGEQPEWFPHYTNAGDWKNARVAAERLARENAWEQDGTHEVTLENIYSNIPSVYQRRDELMALEILCEKKCCLLNREIYDTLCYIKGTLDKPIFLISDMYLGHERIVDLLEHCGADTSLFDDIVISCDFLVSKREGLLYEKVMADKDLHADQLFHIGDNYYSDVGVARCLGIKAMPYDVKPSASHRYPFLWLEGGTCGIIHGLRLLADQKNPYKEESLRKWFAMGAMIIGPICTYATEWVLDTAEKEQIFTIRTLMREGDFLAKLLNKASAHRMASFDIQPFYISRYAAFVSSFDRITEQDILLLLRTRHISLGEVFDILGIEDCAAPFADFLSVETASMSEKRYGDGTLWDAVVEFLTDSYVMMDIRKHNEESSRLIYRYLQQMGLCKPCITLDVGWRGSTQNAMDRIFDQHDIKEHPLHLLFFCKPTTIQNVMNHSRIRGFVGNWGKDAGDVNALLSWFFDLMFQSHEGTTIGYREEAGQVVPVTVPIEYPAAQVQAMQCVQEGILAFQETYHSVVQQHEHLRRWAGYEQELCKLVRRLHCQPLLEEAKLLGGLRYDQNFGANTFVQILPQQILAKRRRSKTRRAFYSRFISNAVVWYSGINVLAYSGFYLENMFIQQRSRRKLALLYLVEDALRIAGSQSIIIVGAGRNARDMLRILSVFGKLSCVEGLVDNNRNLQGSAFAGKSIYGVEHNFSTNIYLCSIFRKNSCDSLMRQIRNSIGRDFKFIHYYMEDKK